MTHKVCLVRPAFRPMTVPEPQQIHSVSPPLKRIGGAAGVQAEVFDVQRQHLAGPGGGLVQHPPQGLLSQRNVATSQRPVDRRAGHRAGGVEVLAAPSGAGRQDRGRAAGWRRTRTAGGHGAAVAVPSRRGPLPPQLLQQAGQFLPADLGQRAAGAKPGEQPVQHAGVAAPGVRAGVPRPGQEGAGRGLDRAGVPVPAKA